MSIYTRTGDAGETDSGIGTRLRKDSPLFEALGTFDEFSCLLGLALGERLPEGFEGVIRRVQADLLRLGALVIHGFDDRTEWIDDAVAAMETLVDELTARLEPLNAFVLPGPHRTSASLHLARAVCRRAERRTVTFAEQKPGPGASAAIVYLNRLSDLLFTMARTAEAPKSARQPSRRSSGDAKRCRI